MKAKKIILSILDENAVAAKNLISEDLAVKLGQRLAEEYVRVAKTTFNEADNNLANNYPPFDKVTRGDIIAAGKDEEQDGEAEEGEEEGEDETVDMPTNAFDVRLSYNG